ncbi:NRAMP family divalent metal transporter [Ferroacidibacillus organovorans]|uniref:Metal transporter n=1 Tax=Ferroacidibacillus organovorans TaxID=1765683 RepID=A0A1V4ERI5_9BACL|nr:NRAMP family divalent metal transporter [Ferroacidibacillus organovorans]OPG15549.1 hypothetical protein B2M26_10755 [Ferroacidibacillus organovorans]
MDDRSQSAHPTPLILEREDIARAKDRLNVIQARSKGRPLRLLWLLVGPGILVMLGENDAPSMLSYAQTGASYGIGFFLPFIVLTFAMAYVVQEMTVRLAAATHRGHAELIFDRFGRFWGIFAMIDLVIGNVLTLVTEFIGIRAGMAFFGLPAWLSAALAILVVIAAISSRRYFTWERIAMSLAVFNLIFVPVALMAHPHPTAILHALGTFSPLPGGFSMNLLVQIMADVGATVTPWMLFFQQSAAVDKGITKQDLTQGRIDTGLGAFIASIAAIATVVACSPLFFHHVNLSAIGQSQFATVLLPYVGHIGASLFALGLIEAGLVATIMISTSSAYALGEVAKVPSSLNRKIREAPWFYVSLLAGAVIAAIVILIPGAPLQAISITVNVIATLLMPPALLFLILLVNDRQIMGSLANRFFGNAVGWTIIMIITAMGSTYGLLTVFPHLIHSS